MFQLFFSALLSAFLSFLVTKYTMKNDKKDELDAQFDEILKISIQYPYLEVASFISTWNSQLQDTEEDLRKKEMYERYEQYATLIFNHLEKRCKFYNFNIEEIEKDDLDIKSWVKTHEVYWQDSRIANENLTGYSKEFREIVNQMLARR